MSASNEIRAAARMHGAMNDVKAAIDSDATLEEPGLAALLLLASLGTDMPGDIDPDVMKRGARLLDDGALLAALEATGPLLNVVQLQREILIGEMGRRKGAKENH